MPPSSKTISASDVLDTLCPLPRSTVVRSFIYITNNRLRETMREAVNSMAGCAGDDAVRALNASLTACPVGRFGDGCMHSFKHSTVYLPAQRPATFRCAAAAVQRWFCTLPLVPARKGTMSGHEPSQTQTVAKTTLWRIAQLHNVALEHAAWRPGWSDAAWSWRPQVPGCQRPGSWLGADACASKVSWTSPTIRDSRASTSILPTIRDSRASTSILPTIRDSRASTSILPTHQEDRHVNLRGLAVVNSVRAALATRNMSQDAGVHYVASLAAVWWFGQASVHTIASLGPCGAAAAAELPLTTPLAPTVDSMEAAAPSLVVGVHMRRGDACDAMRDGRSPHRRRLRECFTAAAYTAAIERMRAAYTTQGQLVRVLLASDSDAATAELASALAGTPHPRVYDVQVLRYNRTLVGGGDAFIDKRFIERRPDWIERRNAAGGLNRTLVFASLYAELSLLSHADCFVGTSVSWVSRLALFAIIGRLGGVPPYAFLDAPLGCMYSVCHRTHRGKIPGGEPWIVA